MDWWFIVRIQKDIDEFIAIRDDCDGMRPIVKGYLFRCRILTQYTSNVLFQLLDHVPCQNGPWWWSRVFLHHL